MRIVMEQYKRVDTGGAGLRASVSLRCVVISDQSVLLAGRWLVERGKCACDGDGGVLLPTRTQVLGAKTAFSAQSSCVWALAFIQHHKYRVGRVVDGFSLSHTTPNPYHNSRLLPTAHCIAHPPYHAQLHPDQAPTCCHIHPAVWTRPFLADVVLRFCERLQLQGKGSSVDFGLNGKHSMMSSLDEQPAKASGGPATPISLSINILRVSNDCVTRQSVLLDHRTSMRESLPDGNWPEDILFEQRSASVSTPRDEVADEVRGN